MVGTTRMELLNDPPSFGRQPHFNVAKRLSAVQMEKDGPFLTEKR